MSQPANKTAAPGLRHAGVIRSRDLARHGIVSGAAPRIYEIRGKLQIQIPCDADAVSSANRWDQRTTPRAITSQYLSRLCLSKRKSELVSQPTMHQIVVIEPLLRLRILSLPQEQQEVAFITGQAQEDADCRSVRPKKSVKG